MVMIFENQQVLNYLLSHGFVYTFRTHKRLRLGTDWITDKRGGKKIANVRITFIKITRDLNELMPFLKHSGFNNIIDWNTAIMELNPDFVHKEMKYGYLYRVSIIEG